MIDFHCHLDLYPDPDREAQHAQDSSVALLSVTTTPSAFLGTKALAKGRPMIRTALGLHPELAEERRHELALFDKLLPETSYVGEIGLDGSSRHAQSRTTQLEVFDHILRSCANAGGRVLSIHSRGAVPQVLDSLRDVPGAGTPVLHWFTGTTRQAEAALQQGCWFSIGSPMLRSAKGQELLAMLPRERVLTETDGPFVALPHGPSRPVDVQDTIRLLALRWGVTEVEATARLHANLRHLHISPPAG